MYKITIKGSNPGVFYYAQSNTKKVMREVEITDESGVKRTELTWTGAYELEDFHTDDLDDLKEKYIELLKTHHEDELNIIKDVDELVTIDVSIDE